MVIFSFFIDAAILCFTLWLFARHEAELGLYHLVLVVLGINIFGVIIMLGLTSVLINTILAPYIMIIALALNFIIAIFILCRFCYVSLLQASKAYGVFMIIKICLNLF